MNNYLLPGKNYINHLSRLIFMTYTHISPPAEAGQALQGLFLEFAIFSTNICAALPLKKLQSSKIFIDRKLCG